jgi:hypothetical protein
LRKNILGQNQVLLEKYQEAVWRRIKINLGGKCSPYPLQFTSNKVQVFDKFTFDLFIHF